MSNKKVTVDEISDAVMEYLTIYGDDIKEDVKEAADETTKAARDELKKTSPRSGKKRKNPYYRGWSVRVKKSGKYKYTKVVWNRTNYQLTHLLENGHLKRNGTGWVPPQVHIKPVAEKYEVKFVDLLTKKIKESSK